MARARLEEGSSCAARAEPTAEQRQGVRELNHGGMILQRRGASIVKVPVNPGCGGFYLGHDPASGVTYHSGDRPDGGPFYGQGRTLVQGT